MNIFTTPLAGLNIAETLPFKDQRGMFERLFCAQELSSCLGERRIVQINHSRTVEVGAIRGIHYQHTPHAEMKLVRCIRGRVWDVAVDIRADSPTFLRWYGMELDGESGRMLVIPEGFAHGFQVLKADSELLYLHTEFYTPEAEGGLRYDDPQLAIEWPLPVGDLSARDRTHRFITAEFNGLSL